MDVGIPGHRQHDRFRNFSASGRAGSFRRHQSPGLALHRNWSHFPRTGVFTSGQTPAQGRWALYIYTRGIWRFSRFPRCLGILGIHLVRQCGNRCGFCRLSRRFLSDYLVKPFGIGDRCFHRYLVTDMGKLNRRPQRGICPACHHNLKTDTYRSNRHTWPFLS